MNRLWVRLSLAISGLILVFVVLPFIGYLVLVATLRDNPFDNHPPPMRPGMERRPRGNPWSQIPETVISGVVLVGVLGMAGGIAASWILAAPITKLAAAAQSIGKGDLTTRVQLRTGSVELDGLAQSFNKMAAELQRANEVRTNLMADVSHELRTPLTVLEGNLRAALDQVAELDEEQVANLYQQTHHLIQLVNDLRELTLAEARQLPLHQEFTSLTTLVEETAAVFEPLAAEKQITLTAQIAPGFPPLKVDRLRLRQVLHNLLANALRHTPPGGAITILGQVEARQATLSVQDSGDGIEAQHLAHVFDRFYRTDPSRSRESGGSGLGLAIVKAIVEAHGGSISASSAGAGTGSTFRIALPL
jgi:two-component system OmpR family sensor kinase/two-component system sensor histidine kinase BaeS